jgi:riboflavin kinase/FMN adenylyltransferase
MLQFGGVEVAQLPARPLHLAVGMFDGVHLGHQSVIEAAIHSARRSGGLAGVLTFWPHPSVIFRPEAPAPLLMYPETKRAMFSRLGVDFVIEQEFSHEFAAMTAGEFVPWLRRHLPQIAAIYVGENWRFGRDRQGDVAMLVELAQAAGLAVYSAPRLKRNGAPVSSSRIRELVASGDIAAANAMLGYSYFSEGTVQRGRQLGRTIGFPTLNFSWEPALKPRYGVYAVEVSSDQGTQVKGVANYGLRPTVEQTEQPLLEVHLLEPSTFTYGDHLTVRWLHFLRPEGRFENLERLRAQIQKDQEKAQGFFAGNGLVASPKDA